MVPALLLLLCAAAVRGGEGLPHWLAAIDADQLKGDVGFLASEELAGRAVLTPGARTAAAFIASRFQALGLKPAGEGSRDWYQRVPLVRTPIRSGSLSVTVSGERKAGLDLVRGEGFRCRPVAASGIDIDGRAVFAGHGIHAPDLGHDDYQGLEVKRRVVVVLDGGPTVPADADAERGLSSRRYSSWMAKRREARSRGAAALVVLPRPGGGKTRASLHPDFWHDVLTPAGGDEEDRSCPAIFLEEKPATELAALAGIGPDAAPGPLSGVRISCTLKMGPAEEMFSRNVLALIPGSNDLHFREFVIVSAHYDHLGVRGEGRVFPGADDNASGVAAMLGAARALASLPANRRPARSILFIAWAGEERGFLGSTQFSNEPTVPIGQIKAVVNLDMVGRNHNDDEANHNTALAVHSAQVPDFEWLLDGAAEAAGLDLRLRPAAEIGRTSDHWPFHRLNIPAVHVFTGIHGDYNTPDDTAEKINYDKLLRITRTAALLAFQLADADETPVFDEKIEKPQTRIDPF